MTRVILKHLGFKLLNVAVALVCLGTFNLAQARDKLTVAGWSKPISEITNLLAEPR